MKNETNDKITGKAVEMQEKNTRKRLKIGGILIVLFMLLYVPSLLNWLSKDNISSDILRIGTIEEIINTEALLIRDEVLLEVSEKDGQIIPDMKEGDRVPAFCTIATISDKKALSLLEKLEKVNDDIIKAQNEKAQKTDFFSEDMAKLDDSISLRVQDLVWSSRNNSLHAIKRLQEDIDGLMERKTAIAGQDDNDPVIKALNQKRDQIQKQINANTSQVSSKYSGILSYTIDGYENTLTTKKLKDLTPEFFGKITIKKERLISEYGNVDAGKPFAKVIKGYTTVLAVILSQKEAEEFAAGSVVKRIRLNDIGSIVSGRITGNTPKGNGKNLLTIEIDRYSEQLSAYRKINVDLIEKWGEGLKIPVKCLYSPDDNWKKAKVMLIKANIAAERIVNIECIDKEYAIISSSKDESNKTVSLYDTYILNPEIVEEGQIILK